MPSINRLGNGPERTDDVLGLLGKAFQADRDEGTRIFDLAAEQCASLVLIEVEIGVGRSGVPKYFCQSRGVPRSVLANIHDGEMESKDLG